MLTGAMLLLLCSLSARWRLRRPRVSTAAFAAPRFTRGTRRPIRSARMILRFQKDSALARWYQARTADRRADTRKTMIVALARKLLIALWRFVTTGETLEGVVLRPAA